MRVSRARRLGGCVTVTARLASTHTALVSQSLVGLCFAFPSINQSAAMGKWAERQEGFFSRAEVEAPTSNKLCHA